MSARKAAATVPGMTDATSSRERNATQLRTARGEARLQARAEKSAATDRARRDATSSQAEKSAATDRARRDATSSRAENAEKMTEEIVGNMNAVTTEEVPDATPESSSRRDPKFRPTRNISYLRFISAHERRTIPTVKIDGQPGHNG